MKLFLFALALVALVLYTGAITGAFVSKEILPALQSITMVQP